ncbi:MAG TPA: tRNA (guanosine(46)-N7)-methyltransferase TrmB [Chloroflexia bacterium]|nr:tRNA (guanosine(46)-N7)-methyltransferase TrmB [Chloroflexia bacterium]
MPPRKTFLIRHVRVESPDEATAGKYLRVWHAGDLWNHPDTFPRITSEALFGNSRPLEMEVGCSTGEYLCSLAQAAPDRNFLGVEINLKSLYLAVQNAAKLGLDNVLFIKVPIQSLYQLMPPDALSAVYMHFPDPYLHPKYRTRRMFTPDFLDKMHDALVAGGKISIVTDKEELFWDMLAIVEHDTHFRRTHAERYLTGFEPAVKSRYQEYWERHDSAVYRFEVSNVK